VDLSGWVVVGLGGNSDCRCGILYALMLGGVAGLVSLTSRYSSELLVLSGGGGLVCLQGFAVCVCVHRLGAFGFLWEREHVCEM